jgi:peptidoglycan/LPS O-acetylase OafA/YrhL
MRSVTGADLPAVESSTPSPWKWLPPLDGLRGLAILLVMLAHFGRILSWHTFPQKIFHSLFAFGGTGVDLFFVLSGFLITGILLDSRNADNYFSAFYMRRVLRILPLYYFSVAFVLIFFRGSERQAFWYLIYAQNWRLSIIPQLGHFWSLAVEEQFYLLWPLVVWRFDSRAIFRIAIAGSVLSVVLRLMLIGFRIDPVLIYHNTFTRMDALLIGAACACIMRDRSLIGRVRPAARWLWLLPLVALLAVRLASRWTTDRFLVEQTFGYSIVAMSYAGLLLTLVFGLGVTTPGQRFFSSAAMRLFGRYSYGAYVWHPLVQRRLPPIERSILHALPPWFIQIPFLVGATLLVSMCCYALIERPFLNLKRHFNSN